MGEMVPWNITEEQPGINLVNKPLGYTQSTHAEIPECLSSGASPFPQVNQTRGAAGSWGRFAIAHMHAHHGASGEGTTHITLWFGQNDVHLMKTIRTRKNNTNYCHLLYIN